MSRFFDGTGDYLSQTQSVLTAAPLSMACWYSRTQYTEAAGVTLLCVGVNNSNANKFSLFGGTSGRVAAQTTDSSSSNSGGAFGNGLPRGQQPWVWSHAAAVYASTTSRIAYQMGYPSTEETTSRTPVNIDRLFIGANPDTNSPFAGWIAHPAFWNVALTREEIVRLAAGVSPLMIRPTNLIRYFPTLGAGATDVCVVSGTALTVTNALPSSFEPQLIPRRRRIYVPASSATFKAAWAINSNQVIQ